MATATLDCGHVPSPHNECTTGYARYIDIDGTESTICYECAYIIALRDMNRDGQTFGYWEPISTPEKPWKPLKYDIGYGRFPGSGVYHPGGSYLGHITTWTGKPLLTVLSVVRRYSYGATLSDRYYFRAKGTDGSYWHGIGQGEGMYVRMKRSK